MAKIKAMICNVDEPACVVEIENELETYQEIVGGYIETFYPFGDDICCIVNEEGKFTQEMNRPIYNNGELVDVICGNFLCVNAPAYSEDFESLTDEQIEKCRKAFGQPHSFMIIGKKIMVL